MSEVAAGIKDWDLLQKLPPAVAGFKLVPGTGVTGQILNIAAYVSEAMHCRLDITYTSETFDYVPVKTVGLHSFRDVRYFCRDREHFAQLLLKRLPTLIKDIDRQKPHKLGFEARGLHFENWDYWRSLPQKIGSYDLYITPDNPLEYINGSFIFLDYSDFQHGNQIYFAYNIFRNELFAEMRKQWLPLTTDAFDVAGKIPDEHKLQALTVLLKERLEPLLAGSKKGEK